MIVGGDDSRFGNVLESVRRQGCAIESIQFLVVLEFMFQKVQEANSVDQDFSSYVRVQCVCVVIYLFL